MNFFEIIGMLVLTVWVKIKKPAMYLLMAYGLVSLIWDIINRMNL